MNKRWYYFSTFLLASVVLFIFAFAPLLDDRLHLVFCDVGQGDGILIYRRQTQIVVDSGPDSKILSCLSRHMPFWDRSIELAVITNADLDHYGGFIDVVRRYQIAAFATTEVGKEDLAFEILEKEVKTRKIKTSRLDSGDQIKFGQLVLQTIWPQNEFIAENSLDSQNGLEMVLGAKTSNGSPNEFSLVLALSYGQFDALLTGDIVPPATDKAVGELRGGRKVGFEVLKVPHHGSKNGLTLVMLEAVAPQVAIISAGRNNRFGHPHKEVIKLISDWGIRILRTDREGEIELISDGKGYWVNK